MATILAHIVIRPGKEASFESIAASLHSSSHATEKHLRAYGYWRGQTPRSYYTLLAFEDFMGFMEHQTSSHHEDVALDLRECIESMRLEWVDPIEGASTLAPSNPQEVPADAPPLLVRYAGMMPVQLAEWWQPLRSARTEGQPG